MISFVGERGFRGMGECHSPRAEGRKSGSVISDGGQRRDAVFQQNAAKLTINKINIFSFVPENQRKSASFHNEALQKTVKIDIK